MQFGNLYYSTDFSEYVYQVLFKTTTEIFTMPQYPHIPEIYIYISLVMTQKIAGLVC